MSGASRSFAALAAAAVIWICSAGSALALDLLVDTTIDSTIDNPLPGVSFRRCDPLVANDCSLRGAILRANAVPGPHVITVPAGTYPLTLQGANEDAAQTGDLDVLQNITIDGVSPALTVITWDATAVPNVANRDRIFHVLPAGNLTIRDLSIRLGGRGVGTSDLGGGIYSEGALTMERVSSRLHQQGYGAGVLIQSAGNTVIRSSAINTNSGSYGPGIYAHLNGAATLLIENTTISDNQASDVGGGLYLDAASTNALATLSSVTVATNRAGTAGGLHNAGATTLVLRNTIVANNTAVVANPNCLGTISSQGYNLVFGGADTCGMSAGNNDLVNSTFDPKLGTLQGNGGPTATHALDTGSAALDKGNPAVPGSGGSACPATDQRGLTRAIDGDADGVARCDIGAAEGGRWFMVDTTDDNNALQTCDTNPNNGNCSLRGAITVANAANAASIITLPATGAGNAYRLTTPGVSDDTNATGDLDIRTDITIVGGGASVTIVDGNQIDRVFDVRFGASSRLQLQDLTVQNGHANSDGGGIVSFHDVSLLRVRLRANDGDNGGGIFISGARLTVTESTVSENRANNNSGGGIFLQVGTAPNATMTVANSTISRNRADFGGGLMNVGTSVVNLKNVTIAGNTAVTSAGGLRQGGPVFVQNSIVAGNTAPTNPNCGGAGTPSSQGFNLVFGGDTCGFTQGSDQQNKDPRLGPLQFNGGTTETMALLTGSAAIDAGNPATPGSGGVACSATDQRGLPRPIDGDGVSGPRCDIGAHEATTCTTHPRVAVQTQKTGPGQVRTTITASLGSLVQLRLGQPRPLQNASVSVQGGPQNITSAQDVTVSGAQVVITVTRQGAPGTSVTVPFQVIDGCTAASPWSTFVGFGSGV